MTSLSLHDVRRLQVVQRALLRPVTDTTFGAWADTICSSTRELLGIDHVYFYEPCISAHPSRLSLSAAQPPRFDSGENGTGHAPPIPSAPENLRRSQPRRRANLSSSGDGEASSVPDDRSIQVRSTVLPTHLHSSMRGDENPGATGDVARSAALSSPLRIHSPSAGDALTNGIQHHFEGFRNGFMQFRESYPTLQHRLVRSAGTGAFHDAPLHDWSQQESLDIYQEVFRPLGIDRKIAISTPLPRGEAMLISGYAHTDAPAYNGRRHRLLQLLVPAFETSIQFRHRLSRVPFELATVVDTLPVPLLIFDADAREQHRNHAFRQVLGGTGDADAIARAAQQLAHGLRPSSASDDLPPAQQTIRLASGMFTLRGHLGDASAHQDPVILVSIDRASALPAPETLTARSDLTPREAEVAALMARGRTDQEIADDLVISVHTARRHASSVLQKLDLPSRAGVALALLSL